MTPSKVKSADGEIFTYDLTAMMELFLNHPDSSIQKALSFSERYSGRGCNKPYMVAEKGTQEATTRLLGKSLSYVVIDELELNENSIIDYLDWAYANDQRENSLTYRLDKLYGPNSALTGRRGMLMCSTALEKVLKNEKSVSNWSWTP